jgi:hypothetical protein
MIWQLDLERRGRGRPRYSRPGGRRYTPMITTSNGHGTSTTVSDSLDAAERALAELAEQGAG